MGKGKLTTIYCDSSTKKACYIIEGQEAVVVPYPEPVTVNVGEYKAVVLALKEAKRLKLEQVELLTDSRLVVCQVNGLWQCRKAHLLPFRDKTRKLLQDSEATIQWVAREKNLAGKILDRGAFYIQGFLRKNNMEGEDD